MQRCNSRKSGRGLLGNSSSSRFLLSEKIKQERNGLLLLVDDYIFIIATGLMSFEYFNIIVGESKQLTTSSNSPQQIVIST
jgi:hypothetical protein